MGAIEAISAIEMVTKVNPVQVARNVQIRPPGPPFPRPKARVGMIPSQVPIMMRAKPKIDTKPKLRCGGCQQKVCHPNSSDTNLENLLLSKPRHGFLVGQCAGLLPKDNFIIGLVTSIDAVISLLVHAGLETSEEYGSAKKREGVDEGRKAATTANLQTWTSADLLFSALNRH